MVSLSMTPLKGCIREIKVSLLRLLLQATRPDYLNKDSMVVASGLRVCS